MLELDHLIVFLRGPDDVDALRPGLAGLVLDEGTRHVGQGTRNRRIVFPDSYIELLWVDSRAEAQASGLRFTQHCMGDGCPLGVVLRGRVPERPGFVEYTVPAGPTLHIVDDPRMPFLAVHGSDDLDLLRPVHRMASEYLNRARVIAPGDRLWHDAPRYIRCAPGVLRRRRAGAEAHPARDARAVDVPARSLSGYRS